MEIGRLVVRRLAQLIVVLLGVSLLISLLIRLIPGGPANALIPIENKRSFFDVASEVLETIDPIFFGDVRAAGNKALGLT